MQADVNAIADWSAANKLPINFENSVALHYGKANPRRQYFINKDVIKSEKYVVDLGVCRSETFSYEEYIYSSHCIQSRKTAGMVLKVFSTRDRLTEFLKRVYSVYVRPTLKYASFVWRSSSISLNAILEKLQRKYIERINGLKDLSYKRRLSVLGLQSLTQRLQYIMTWSQPINARTVYQQLLTNRLVYVYYKPLLERKVCVLCIKIRSHIFSHSVFNQEIPLYGTVYLMLLSRVAHWVHSN